MSTLKLRLAGAGMTTLATVALVLSFMAAAEQPAEATGPCCQACEVWETACFAACDTLTDPDEQLGCWQQCEYDLFDGVNACYRRCNYCERPPLNQGEVWFCYECGFYGEVCWLFPGIGCIWIPQIQCNLVMSGQYCA